MTVKERPSLSSVEEYFSEAHALMRRRLEGEEVSASCLMIACDIAKRRLAEGGEPELLGIRPLPRLDQMELFPLREDEAVSINPENLPKLTPWQGTISWSCHVACIEAGMVFDPMLDEPLDLETYKLVAFREPVVCTVLRDTERLRQEAEEYGSPWKCFHPEEQALMNPHMDEWNQVLERMTP